MNITDEMVAAACYAWTRDSRPLQCEIDAMRAALAAALAVQPQPARVPLPVALPPLPEPSGHTWGYDARMNMTRTPNGHYTANDVYEYGKKCLAAAGVTVADGGAK